MSCTSLSPVSTTSSLHDSPDLEDVPPEAPPPSGTSTRSCKKKKLKVITPVPPKSQSKNGDSDWRSTTATYYAQLQTIMFENPLPTRLEDEQTSHPSPVNPKEMKCEILGRAVGFIKGLLEEQKRLSHSLSEKENAIQTSPTQHITSSPPITLSTFIESHSLSSRPRLPLNQNGLEGLCAPAALPGLPCDSADTKQGEEQNHQSNAYWEEGIAQLCMPKGAILPVAPILPDTNDNGLALSSPSSNQSAFTVDHCQQASIADPTSVDPSFQARITRRGAMSALVDRSATNEAWSSASIDKVPDITIPTLPSHLSLQNGNEFSAIHARPIEPPTPATSLHDSTSAPSLVEDSFSATSDGITPSTSNKASSVGDISPAKTDVTSTLEANVSAEAAIRDLSRAPAPTIGNSRDTPFDLWAHSQLNKGTSHSESWYQSLPNYFEKYSDVYSTAFPSLSSPSTALEQSKSNSKSSNSNKRKTPPTVEVKVSTSPIPGLGRRLSIVSTPRRGGIAAGSPGSGYEENIPEMETDKVIHLATMPSLKNLRIHTSTIRGRRHQKKINSMHVNSIPTTLNTDTNGENVLAARDNALGLSSSSTENALGLYEDITPQALLSSSEQGKQKGTAKSKIADASVGLPATEGTAASTVNLPGGADFQPSAAAKMTLQSNSSSFDSSYSDYMQYLETMVHLQMPNQSIMHPPDHTRVVYVPVSPEEDCFKLPKTIVSESTISNSPDEVQKKQRNYRSYPNASQHIAQMTYQGQSHQNQYQNGPSPYTYSDVPMYPASVPYYTGYPVANAPEHQHRIPSITYANLTQQSNAHKRRFGMGNYPSYSYSYAQPPITNTGINSMQTMSMSQMTCPSIFNMQNIPRFSTMLHQNQQSLIQNQNINNLSTSLPCEPINLPTMPMPDLNQALQPSMQGGLETPSHATEEADHLYPSKRICTGLA